MAHYAFINDNNEVIEVITGIDENDTSTLPSDFANWEEFYLSLRPNATNCKRTSYNTFANTHKDGGTPYRANYASIGFKYDTENDVFIPPKPYDSWTLNNNWIWEAPVEHPNDNNSYTWNEENQSWDLIE